jgi:hypothetical protein
MKTIISEIPRRYAWIKGRYTLEIGYPWISMGAILAIEGVLNHTHRVLETGAGGSTVFFAKRALSVRSYERSEEWLQKTQNALDTHGVRD